MEIECSFLQVKRNLLMAFFPLIFKHFQIYFDVIVFECFNVIFMVEVYVL